MRSSDSGWPGCEFAGWRRPASVSTPTMARGSNTVERRPGVGGDRCQQSSRSGSNKGMQSTAAHTASRIVVEILRRQRMMYNSSSSCKPWMAALARRRRRAVSRIVVGPHHQAASFTRTRSATRLPRVRAPGCASSSGQSDWVPASLRRGWRRTASRRCEWWSTRPRCRADPPGTSVAVKQRQHHDSSVGFLSAVQGLGGGG